MSSHEVANRTALRNLIASLTSWQTWTGLNETNSKLRIGWPESGDLAFPCIVIVILAGARVNSQGSDSSANFRSRGGLGVLVFDKIDDGDDLTAADTAFATNFFGLMDDLIEAAHATELMIEQIDYGENPYEISSINSSHPVDANSDGVDDEATIEQLFFHGAFQIQTGGA